jgi:hypothetical protein
MSSTQMWEGAKAGKVARLAENFRSELSNVVSTENRKEEGLHGVFKRLRRNGHQLEKGCCKQLSSDCHSKIHIVFLATIPCCVRTTDIMCYQCVTRPAALSHVKSFEKWEGAEAGKVARLAEKFRSELERCGEFMLSWACSGCCCCSFCCLFVGCLLLRAAGI